MTDERPNSITNEEISSMLKEIEATSPTIDWEVILPDRDVIGVITLPYDCFISGTLSQFDDGKRSMLINMFHVNEKLRKHGIGTRLLKNLAVVAKSYGAKELRGHVTSKSALMRRISLFGYENLRFVSHVLKTPSEMSKEKLILLDDKDLDVIDVITDLTNIDVTGWEHPVDK